MKNFTHFLNKIRPKDTYKKIVSTYNDALLAQKISQTTNIKFQEVFLMKEKRLHPLSFNLIHRDDNLIVFEASINTFYLAKISLLSFQYSYFVQHTKKDSFPALNAWFLGDVIIQKEFMQRQGFGEQIYDFIGNYLYNEHGQSFVSSHHLSEGAQALWKKLVRKGKAQVLDNGNDVIFYKYLPENERDNTFF